MATSTDRRSLRRRIVDLPVGSKLLIGFGALTLLLTLVIACLVLTVNRLGAANSIVGTANARSQAADQLRFSAADMRAAQQAYVLGGRPDRPAFDRSLSRFEAALDQLRVSAGDPVEHALIQKIATGYQTFLATDQLIWSALQEDDHRPRSQPDTRRREPRLRFHRRRRIAVRRTSRTVAGRRDQPLRRCVDGSSPAWESPLASSPSW